MTGFTSVVADLEGLLESLRDEPSGSRAFCATYLRTTVAVLDAVQAGGYEDPAWVEDLDVVFAQLYVDALAAHQAGSPVPRPWQVAFDAFDPRSRPAGQPRLPDLAHVLLGVNAHINYDLPQALLAVISAGDFDDKALLASRHRDHERIDAVISSRVRDEGDRYHPASLLDRVLIPLNRAASKRFLREARRRVWHNTRELHAARLVGEDVYAGRLFELEVLSAAKMAELLAPGQVLLKLAVSGFGVVLPPPARP